MHTQKMPASQPQRCYGPQGLQNPRDREHAKPGQTSSRNQPVRKSALERGKLPQSIAVLGSGWRKSMQKSKFGCWPAAVQDLNVFWPSEATFLL